MLGLLLTAAHLLAAIQGAPPQIITHGARTHKWVVLSFDACETRKPAGYDAKIIDILTRTHTPATLFLGGHWMETHPSQTRALAANPLFELGDHSYLHPHMTKITTAQIDDDLRKTQAIHRRLTGREATLFRPPYGEYNATVLKEAAHFGMQSVTWEVVTGDPDKHVQARDITRAVLRQTKPGSIVIMHVNGRGWHTAEALPAVIDGLKRRGFTFARLSETLK
ncbi:MAG: polysaccharide deacetylase family protein [Capsulimonas sp.]|uniref:polysaccharide deacetylase family protein n=1 Tax=Capsulimonas sp. TaxID=2494211 RepID=UPI003264D9C7